MHDRTQLTLPPLDLSRYTEASRRALYDFISAEYFNGAPAPGADSDDFVETRSPDEAGLMVFYALGRWFAVWRMADPPPMPRECDLWEAVALSVSPRGVLSMAEV
ncbi:MAG TPA: hypothetical protein VGS22_23775 [Thermoanaerobaculia bacterium]|jgi:hypothetical protein|nr:hypothetical protein [Thermoanaerobaculia bacterium]